MPVPASTDPPSTVRLPGLRANLDWHRAHYPLLGAADIYKLVHQGVFGPGHMIADAVRARQALEKELAVLRRSCCAVAVEPEEPLDPDGRLVRVNLEPLKPLRDAVDRLLPVLLATAAETASDPAVMADRLAQALAWCRETLHSEEKPLSALVAASGEAGWPARHHSAAYAIAYRPAYRVVSARRWRQARRPCGTSG